MFPHVARRQLGLPRSCYLITSNIRNNVSHRANIFLQSSRLLPYPARMSGGHHHDHHTALTHGRAFLFGIALNIIFVVVEVIAGFASDSMALLADGGHNLSDVLGLGLAWAGAAMARRPSSQRFTYGLKKAPILAALGNAILLLVAIGAILAEGIRRLFHPEPADGWTVIAVAALGVVINTVTALLFVAGRKHDINIRSAFVHMAADAGISLGVVIAGAVIVLTGQLWIDPVVSIAIALVILWGTFDLLKQSTWMSLAAVPPEIELADVQHQLIGVEGVEAIHDLHVWPMSTTENALTAHLVVPEHDRREQILGDVRRALHDHFKIDHVTVQIDSGDGDNCIDC